MMSNKGIQDTVVCPYNPAHVLLKHRFQTHLVKCRKNYPDTEKVTCMYNSTHRIPKPEIAFHHDNCPDRAGLDKFVFTATPASESKFNLPMIDLQPSETWEDEERGTYNPEEHCLNNLILRRKDTLSKAKKKDFRYEERQRLQQLSNEACGESSSVKHDQRERPKPNVSDVSLRRPTTLSKGATDAQDLVEDDVSDMLEKVHLGANTAIVPPRKDAKPVNNQEMPLSENQNPNVPGSFGIGTTSQDSGYNGAKPKTFSRGRGSTFGKK